MNTRAHMLIVAPIAAMLLVHALALAVSGHGDPDRSGWVAWHLTAPVGLLILLGVVLRRARRADDSDESADRWPNRKTGRRLAGWTWAAAAADALATVVLAAWAR